MCRSEKVLLAIQKRVTAKYEELRGWIFGNHTAPYLAQYSAMAERVNAKTYTTSEYEEDYKELQRLEFAMNKQTRVWNDPKHSIRLAKLSIELYDISNELYYIKMDKEHRNGRI